MARKVIIDTDPGIDDAVALTMALFDPRLEVIAVTAVAGNISAEKATRNVQVILDQLDPPRIPRIGMATQPEDGMPTSTEHIWGKDGLGDQDFPVAELHNLHPSEKILYDEVRAAPEQVTILCLGPLTNIANCLNRDPAWATMVGELVIMGGAVIHPGNVTPAAEFNIHCDPESAEQVFASAMTKTLVPLDASDPVIFDFDLLDQLPSDTTRAGEFLRRILPYAFRTHRQHFGLEGIHLHDPVALAALLHPELFRFEEMAGAVETVGTLTNGMTLFDRRRRPQWRKNMDVALECDLAAVKDVVIRGLQAAGRAS